MKQLAIACLVLFATAASSSADPKPDLKKLASERVAAAKRMLERMEQDRSKGFDGSYDPYGWSLRLLDAQLDDDADVKARPTALKDHVDRMTALRDAAAAYYDRGKASLHDVLAADYYLAEAKLWAARGKK
jgi:hypothetical protein